MSSNNVVDEFFVKIKVDSEDYEKGVAELTESNEKLQGKLSKTEDATQKVSESSSKLGESFSETGGRTEELAEKSDKLAEGLEDTEKQMQKTGKSTRENARDIKNTTDEFQKLSTGIGTAISLMAKFTTAMVAGTGFVKLSTDISKAAVELDNLGKKSNTTYKTMKSWEYVGGELGGDGRAMTQAIHKISRGIEAFKTSGDQSLLRFFNLMNVPFLDGETGEALPINDLLMGLTREFAKHDNKANLNYILEEHGLGELFEPLVLNSPQKVQEALNRQQNKFIASDSDLASMREFENNMQEIWNHFDSLNTLFVTNMLPTLIKVQEAIKGVLEYFQENPEQAKIAGVLGMGAGLGITGWTINKLFGKVFGSGVGKGGITGGILTDHVQKVFVVNMGQGGMSGKYPGNPKNKKPNFAMHRGAQAFSSATTIQWAAQSIQDEKEYEENPEARKELLSKFGEDNYRRWASEQGYAYFDRDPNSKNVSELQKIALIGELGDEYGTEQVLNLIRENTSFWDRGALGEVAPVSLDKIVEILEKYSETLVKPETLGQSPTSSLAVGGIGSVANREFRDGNELAREGNNWLKQLYNNPTIKSIESILKKAFPNNPDEAKLPWGGSINQPSASSAFGYSGASSVRDDDYDGTGISPHTGMSVEDFMKMLRNQNDEVESLKDRQELGINYFMSKGFTREQAVGLIANFTRESGMQSDALNPNEMSGGKRFSSKGIAQWNRGRLDNFKEVMGKDITESTLQEQFAFVLWELENTHKTVGKKLRQAKTAEEATAIITQHYEVPANMSSEINKRQEIARGLVGNSFNPYDPLVNQLHMPAKQQQATASSTSTVDVTIGNVTVQTTAQTLSGVGEDMAEAVKARMMLGQLTTGAV